MKMCKPAWLLLLAMMLAGCTTTGRYDSNTEVPSGDPAFPPLGESWVIDQTGMLSRSTIAYGDKVFQKLQDDHVAEVVLAVMRGVKHPQDWTTHYGRWLGLGARGMSTEGGNNGLVLLVRPDAAPEVRITDSVGRGLPRYTSSTRIDIMQRAVEEMEQKDYNAGVRVLVDDTDTALRRIAKEK